jgi:hypothetical protein
VFPVAIVASAANAEDAQARLDAAISVGGVEGSLPDAFKGAASPPWRSLRYTGAENTRVVTVGASEALAVDLLLEITA